MMKNMTGIYIIDGDKILMMKRTKEDSFGEYYSIGGKIEEVELNKPEECILRELQEEAKISKEDIVNICLKYIAFRNTGKLITQNYLFFAYLKNKNIILPACNEGIFEWVSIEDVFNINLPATSRACLEHYFEIGNRDNSVYMAAGTNVSGYGEYVFTELSEFGLIKKKSKII
jgi:ADP-ribose pyrophosphatase